MDKSPVTKRIYAKIFALLERHPEGLRWSELLSKIKAGDESFHPKTFNGYVWKLVQRFPDKVYKPSKGLFRLLKYKSVKMEYKKTAKKTIWKTCSRGHKYKGAGPCPVCWPGQRLKRRGKSGNL
ncbi:MAG: hypothetical protein HY764_01815 [Candidatus Portnoybacteria bacterium]|nr:hypothetical protein [Candidatus Portnoybacteria bacterium]